MNAWGEKRASMNTRERLRAMVNREPLDRGIFWPEGAWQETRECWLAEGMPPDHGIPPDVSWENYRYYCEKRVTMIAES